MPLIDIYSRRKRQAAKTTADVYQYFYLSPKLRQQMIFNPRDGYHTNAGQAGGNHH